MPYRKERLQERIRQEAARVLERERIMPGSLITVLGAHMSSDGRHASVFYSVYPESNSKEADAKLQRGAAWIRKLIAEHLAARPVPELHFVLDTSSAQAQHIEQLLKASSSATLPRHAKLHGRKLRKTA